MQNIANPVVGFRIVTAGDAIAVDYCAHREVVSSITTDAVPGPIGNTATTNALAGDRIVFPYSASTFSFLMYTANAVFSGNSVLAAGNDTIATGWGLGFNDATHWTLVANSINLQPSNAVNFQNLTKVMAAGGPSNRAVCAANGPVASAATAMSPQAYANFVVGGFNTNVNSNWTGDIARLAIWTNQIATNADMGSLTT
jgi:hypothetical protein